MNIGMESNHTANSMHKHLMRCTKVSMVYIYLGCLHDDRVNLVSVKTLHPCLVVIKGHSGEKPLTFCSGSTFHP